MRINRIKADGEGYYHVISRIVNREYLMDEDEKDFFVGLMRRTEKFSAVQVLTFAVLDNHFHILVRVPEREEVGEEVVVKRYKALYGGTKTAALEARWKLLKSCGHPEFVEAEQEALKKRMYDVSEFVKTLKMRYTISYNARHKRTGTLWEERFKSVLVEPDSPAMRRVATYIDLNAVRAKIVKDPSKYRWCGYSEACRGVNDAVKGIESILPLSADSTERSVSAVLREYRSWLGGQTPAGETVFLERICRFSNGLVLGSEKYINEIKVFTRLVQKSPSPVWMPFEKNSIYALRRPRFVTT